MNERIKWGKESVAGLLYKIYKDAKKEGEE